VKPKLVFVILLFVIVPTAVLSLMAVRALRNWEIVLQRRLEVEAAAVVQAVAGRIDTALQHELDQVVTAMSGVQARGGHAQEIRQTAKRLEDSGDLVSRVYLFMNPWDFLYADPPSPRLRRAGDVAEAPNHRDLLLTALRGNIASAPSPRAPLRFSVGESAYVFGLVSMEGLYAGYELSREAMKKYILAAAAQASGGFIVRAEGPGITDVRPGGEPESGADITVTDSFAAAPALRAPRSELRVPMMVETRLAEPFAHVSICAFVADAEQVRNAYAMRTRIYRWAILLMALGIVAGAGFVLHAAAEEIRQARSRSDFVIGVSHDLRTPLSSMKMLTESLYFDNITDPPKRKQFLGTVLSECERLNQLIERVLFLVRFGQEALVFHFDLMDIGDLVNEAVDGLIARCGGVREDGQCRMLNAECGMGEGKGEGDYRTTGENPRIRVAVDPDLPEARIDRAAIRQVLANLLDNAAKYGMGDEKQQALLRPGSFGGQVGGRAAHVDIDVRADCVTTVRVGKRRRRVRISVRDYGMGIEKAALKNIFKRFYRSSRAANANVSGVGLGLALCKHVVRAHRGRIDVQSEVGAGSTFSILLPTG